MSQREQILLDTINALKIQVQDLTSFNIYLRQIIFEIRKQGFSRSAPYAMETQTELEYARKVEVISGHITKNEAMLRTTDRDKKNRL